MKKFFLMTNLNLFWDNLMPFLLFLSLFPGKPSLTWLHPPQGVLESEKVPIEPPFLQAEPLQLCQLLLIGFTL